MGVNSRFKGLMLLGLMLTLSGCALILPSFEGRLEGTVLNAFSGSPVAGSRVWVHGLTTGFTTAAQTNALGQFSVGVPADRYELKLSKPGWASSQVIGLPVSGPTHVEIVQRAAFNPDWSLQAPAIHVLGVSEGGRYQGEIPFRVDVDAENGMDLLYVALGKMPGASFLTAPRQAYSQTDTTGEQVIDPEEYGVRGSTTFEVVVYDKNGNRTHLIRQITIMPEGGPIFEPEAVQAIAVTLGQQTLFFGGRPGPDPTAEAAPAASPGGANIYVELTWTPSPTADIDGYNVYRSVNGVTFDKVATVGAGQTGYRDGGGALSVGNETTYSVSAFRGGDESAWSPTASATPLAPFDVRLMSPADDALGVSTTPVFRWQPTRRVGRHQLYAALLWDTTTGNSTFWITPDPPEFADSLSWTWNQDGRYAGTPWATLQTNRVYEWEMAYAIAVDDLDNPTAVSVAANRLGLSHPNIPIAPFAFDTTDNFTFTTRN